MVGLFLLLFFRISALILKRRLNWTWWRSAFDREENGWIKHRIYETGTDWISTGMLNRFGHKLDVGSNLEVFLENLHLSTHDNHFSNLQTQGWPRCMLNSAHFL